MTTAAKPEQESSKELENAATKIQAVFRGKQAREENNGSAAITVGLRMRPFVPHEKKHGEPKPCIEIADNIVKVVPAAGLDDKDSKEGPWKFDLAMDSSVSTSPVFVNNEKCYQLMGRRMIEDILQGFNTCLFCYGQTGTGKTTTIMGDPTNGPGLLRRLLDDIFAEAGTMRQGGCQVDITVQMLEVYNEELNDLLLEKGKEKKKIETHKLPSGVEVKGATTKVVQSADECQQLIDYGNSNKTIAATNMNPQSSRGHTVFKLEFRKTGGPDGTRLKSEVYFADLAGHENIKTTAVTGDRLKELTFINGSLMWLQNALHSMAEASAKGGNQKVDFSKFRNSKLTLLLSNALTGNSKTAVIVTLSPSIDHFETSLSSIKFAIEVKGIKVKATSTAGKDPKAVIAKLEQENKELKEKLAAAQAGSEGPETQALKDEITSLKEQLAAAGASGGPGDQALRDEEHLGATQPSSARPDTKAFQAKVAELQFKLVAGKAFGPDTKALKGELAELKQQLASSEAIQDEVAQLKSRLAAAESEGRDATALKDEVTRLQEQLATARAGSLQAQGLKDEVAMLQGQLAGARGHAEALTSENSDLKQKLQLLQQQQAAFCREPRASGAGGSSQPDPERKLLGANTKGSSTMEQVMRVLELSKKNTDLFNKLLKERYGEG